MESLEGWELVPDQDQDQDEDDGIGGREKIRSANCPSPISSSSPALEELDTEKKKKEAEDDYQYPVSPELESAKALKDEEDQETKDSDDESGTSGCTGRRGGFDIWKWRLTGIGALCSFGVATALVLGEAPKGKNNSHRCFNLKGYEQNQRLVAAIRGGSVHVPMTTAHITFGGYVCDAHL